MPCQLISKVIIYKRGCCDFSFIACSVLNEGKSAILPTQWSSSVVFCIRQGKAFLRKKPEKILSGNSNLDDSPSTLQVFFSRDNL